MGPTSGAIQRFLAAEASPAKLSKPPPNISHAVTREDTQNSSQQGLSSVDFITKRAARLTESPQTSSDKGLNTAPTIGTAAQLLDPPAAAAPGHRVCPSGGWQQGDSALRSVPNPGSSNGEGNGAASTHFVRCDSSKHKQAVVLSSLSSAKPASFLLCALRNMALWRLWGF